MEIVRSDKIKNLIFIPKDKDFERIRYHSIDIARGIAIFCMLVAHVYLLFPAYIKYNYLGSLAAPFFIIIAGTSYDLLISARVKINIENKLIFLEIFYRALMLITIDAIALFVGSMISPSIYHFAIYFGVFQVIALGYIVGCLIPNNLITKIFSLIGLAFLIVVTGICFSNNAILINISITVFPMLIYFQFGRILFNLLDKQYQQLFSPKFLVIIPSLLLIYSVILYLKGYTIVGDLSTQRYELPVILIICSLMYIIFSVLVRYVDRSNEYLIVLKPFERMGKIAFTLFYLNMIIIILVLMFFLKCLPNIVLPKESIFMYVISIILLVLIFAQFEKLWSKYNYRYGAEWIYRNGTRLLVNITQNII